MADYKGKVRKRGRPRTNNSGAGAEMGDLDISLIREFEARPAFYDRNDPYYKDKIYCENGWDEISNSLGYDGEFYLYTYFVYIVLIF